MLLGVDVGGTFTDAVLVADGRVVTAKAPTTPADQSDGVLQAVRAALERAGRPAADVTAFAHGMTVATNALLEGQGARTALVATAGFTDVVELGRQARKELYRLCAAHPAPLVPPERRVAARERTGPQGVLDPLTPGAARDAAEQVARLGVEAVAVCLLHADRFPEHERALAEALAQAAPGVHVSLSHEVVGTFREFERAATTEVDAALSPLLARYLRELLARARDEGLPQPAIMQSSGGLADAELAAGHAALTVLSGPAGGAAAAALLAERTGVRDLLCFDMGGTSCDVCVVQDGRVRETGGREVGGRPLALPMVDIHTVGAGGGSIAWLDPGGALRAGPRSAGADPGPACYGRGGTEPTVTDANLVLGLLDAQAPLAGDVALDRDAAERAVASLGVEDAAAGIVRVANAEMVRALRVMTVEQGLDPRDFALLAFGGAGGLHATTIAEELGMGQVLVPRAGGVLSALGLAAADRRVDVQRSVLGTGFDLDALAAEARERLGGEDAEVEVAYDCRYRGQSFELTVADPDGFEAAHEERYGFREEDGVVEVVTVRVTARLRGPEVELRAEDRPVERGTRATSLGAETAVLRGDLPEGTRVEGPAVIHLPEATVAVPAGWRGAVDGTGTLRLERDGRR